MPNSLNSVLVAWAVSLIILVGGGLYLEYSYNPDDFKAEDETETPLSDTSEQDTGQNAENAVDSIALNTDRNINILEETAQGLLPRTSRTGERVLDYYRAAPPVDDSTPRIAILITDMGLRARQTGRAIDGLPKEVGFAYSPYGRDLEEWGIKGRQAGHESFLMIPMEPINTSLNDPGPLALLTTRTARENIGAMKGSLGKMTGYVGVINQMGSKFTANIDSIRPVLSEIRRRGLMFVDARTTRFSRAAGVAKNLNIPLAIGNGVIDETPSEEAINAELVALENRARTLGAALGLARPYPVTIDAINAWAAGLEDKGFLLVPVTAIAGRQPVK